MSNFWDNTSPLAIAAADTVEKIPVYADGIHYKVPFDHYLAQDRVSKTGLWDIYERSPAHALVAKEESNAMRNGAAIHCAVLEPDEFTSRFVRGAENRRGNRWLNLVEEHGADNVLTYEEYDNALALRDAIRHDKYVKLLTGPLAHREVSAFATDPVTGLKTRMRADGYVPGHAMMQDLKTTTDARAIPFRQKVRAFGYHLQEAHYKKTWKDAGAEVKYFVFIVVEPKPPFAFKIYDLGPDTIAEGEEIRRIAMEKWKSCVDSGKWPGYETDPEILDLGKYDFKETVPLADEGV